METLQRARAQIEIAFWIAAVKLMKGGKILLCSLLVFTFIFCSSVTLLAAAPIVRLGMQADKQLPQDIVASTWTTALTTGVFRQGDDADIEHPVQHNTLLIFVDQFAVDHGRNVFGLRRSDLPRLEGVWLVVAPYPLSQSLQNVQLTLLPIYPASTDIQTNQDAELVEAFGLGNNGKPAADFLQYLHSRDLWWGNLVVIDEFGLLELAEMVGGISVGGKTVNTRQLIEKSPKAWEDSQKALLSQAVLIQGLCERTGQFLGEVEPDSIFSRLEGHFSTDFDLARLDVSWDNLRTQNARRTTNPSFLGAGVQQATSTNPTCIFPTLYADMEYPYLLSTISP